MQNAWKKNACKTYAFCKDTFTVSSYVHAAYYFWYWYWTLTRSDWVCLGCVWSASGARLGSISGAVWSVPSHNQNSYILDLTCHLTGVFLISRVTREVYLQYPGSQKVNKKFFKKVSIHSISHVKYCGKQNLIKHGHKHAQTGSQL